jgi:hypothetical protein
MKVMAFQYRYVLDLSIAPNPFPNRFITVCEIFTVLDTDDEQVVPLEGSSRGVIEKASRFVISWIRRGLEAEPAKLSIYWQAWNGAAPTFDNVPETVIESQMVDSGTQTEIPIPLGDPEYDWEKFTEAFGATEVDRVLIEEQVKVQYSLDTVSMDVTY